MKKNFRELNNISSLQHYTRGMCTRMYACYSQGILFFLTFLASISRAYTHEGIISFLGVPHTLNGDSFFPFRLRGLFDEGWRWGKEVLQMDIFGSRSEGCWCWMNRQKEWRIALPIKNLIREKCDQGIDSVRGKATLIAINEFSRETSCCLPSACNF